VPPEVVQMLLWIAVLGLIFWLLIIRPAQRRQREVASLQAALSVGDQVMLTSGVYGSVVSVADDVVLVEVAPGVTIKVARAAVGTIVRDEPSDPTETGPADTGRTDRPTDTSEEG